MAGWGFGAEGNFAIVKKVRLRAIGDGAGAFPATNSRAVLFAYTIARSLVNFIWEALFLASPSPLGSCADPKFASPSSPVLTA